MQPVILTVTDMYSRW